MEAFFTIVVSTLFVDLVTVDCMIATVFVEKPLAWSCVCVKCRLSDPIQKTNKQISYKL